MKLVQDPAFIFMVQFLLTLEAVAKGQESTDVTTMMATDSQFKLCVWAMGSTDDPHRKRMMSFGLKDPPTFDPDRSRLDVFPVELFLWEKNGEQTLDHFSEDLHGDPKAASELGEYLASVTMQYLLHGTVPEDGALQQHINTLQPVDPDRPLVLN